MKHSAWLFVLYFLSAVSFAGNHPKMVLDKVAFQITAKEWVNTDTALLTVRINATLTNTDLIRTRSEIMANLVKIAEGKWHITQFDRTQDSSGLEKLSVQAQARVSQASLSNVYEQAKRVSKPGLSYKVDTIEFKPSIEEVQAVKNQLRERLYKQVNQELDRLNKIYGKQTYSLNHLLFIEGEEGAPQKAFQRQEINTLAMPATMPQLAVSNEIIMTASAQAASNRKQEN